MTLDPKAIVIFFIKNFLGTIYVLPIWFLSVYIFEKVWTGNIGILPQAGVIFILDGAGFIFIALLILGCYAWSWLTFVNLTYQLESDGLHVHSGVIIRRNLIIPYNTINSADLLINPFVARFLNLYSLQIKTRELDNTEGIFRKKITKVIPGLSSEVARSLRSELLQYSHVQTVRKTFFDPITGVYK